MNEQNVKLPDFLIADLYKNTLVEISNKQTNLLLSKESKQDLPEKFDNIKFLGKNGKNVIVVVNSPNDVFLSENELTFLTNILKACGLNLSDIGIINYANQEVSYLEMQKQLNPKKILLFGLKTSSLQLPFTVPDFQVQRFDNFTILQCPTLQAMNEQNTPGIELKKKLWTALKGMFNV